MLRMLGAFAEFEREMIRERSKLGLARARLEGGVGGNRCSLSVKQQQHALAMVDGGKSQAETAELFGGCTARRSAGWRVSAACWERVKPPS
jgi:DNA invertase Pin-like site-specific DNA recombinase